MQLNVRGNSRSSRHIPSFHTLPFPLTHTFNLIQLILSITRPHTRFTIRNEAIETLDSIVVDPGYAEV